jgi:hypothetical protein
VERSVQTKPEWSTEEPEWSTENLVKITPVVATTFAFAYVVGYFSAFDISWLPMFSLSEHIVFAIRALPMAIGASVVFLIILIHPNLCSNKRFRRIAIAIWILFLAGGACYTFYRSYFGDGICFVLMIIAVAVYHSNPSGPKSFRRILYWGATLTVGCLIIGWASASSWSWERLHLPLPRTMFIEYGPDSKMSPEGGHVIFAGDKDVLFFGYSSRTTRLLQRDKIQLFECVKEAANPSEIDTIPQGCIPSPLKTAQAH